MPQIAGGPPAKPGRGTKHKGPLYIKGAGINHASQDVRITDEDGVIQPPNTLSLNYYPNEVLPAATAGTPSTVQVQALCKALAALIPQETLNNSTALRLVYRYFYPAQGGSSSGTDFTANPLPAVLPGQAASGMSAVIGPAVGSNFTRYTISETVPVDVLLNNQTLLRDLACRLGSQLAGFLDVSLAGSGFGVSTTVGTGNTALTNSTIASAVAAMPVTGEPYLLFAHPQNFSLGHQFTLNGSPLAEAFSWTPVTGIQSLAFNGSPTPSNAGCYIVPCSGVTRLSTTNYNLMCTPSGLQIAFALDRDINVVLASGAQANAQANGVFENIAVSVWCRNSGSGAQTIYASIVQTNAFVNARCVQVKS